MLSNLGVSIWLHIFVLCRVSGYQFVCQFVSQMDDAYSSCGLTMVVYACDLTVEEACFRFLLSMLSDLCALFVVLLMCCDHLKSCCISMPTYGW